MILSAGESLIDFLPTPDGDFRPVVGGSPLNVSVAAARLGAPAAFFGAVSTDFFGDRILARLAADAVETRHIVRSPAPTPLAFVDLAETEPRYAFYLDGTAAPGLTVADLPESLPDAIHCVQFGSLSLAVEPGATALATLLERESRRRVIALDPNVRPDLMGPAAAYRDRLEGLLPHVDIVKVSAADLAWLYPNTAPDTVAARWRDRGPLLVVITDGSRGAAAWGPFGHVVAPPVRVALADTVGAGDTFHGALLTGLHDRGRLQRAALKTLPADQLQAILGFANRAAAVTCSRVGNDPPTRDDLAAIG